MGGIVGEREWVPGFFFKAVDTHGFIHAQHAEIPGFFDGPFNGSDDGVGLRFQKEPVHVGIVHFIDMITGQHQQVGRPLLVKEKKILKDGVGRSAVPFCTNSLLWRNRHNEFPQFGIEHIPSGANVPIQRMGFVLDKDGDFSQAGVQAIAQRHIDDPILATKGDGWFGAMLGQGK